MKKRFAIYLLLGGAELATCLVPLPGYAAPGDLYVSDNVANQITKITPHGAKTVFVSGLDGPEGLAFDRNGNLFVANSRSGAILEFTPGGIQSTFASGLSRPDQLAFDGEGNLFVADGDSGTIFKFTSAGTKSTFASGLHQPAGLAFDAQGNLFEADFATGVILKFTPDGTKSTFASDPGGDPLSLAFDSDGNLFLGSGLFGDIFKFGPTGTFLSTFALNLHPGGLAFDAAGNLFATDATGVIFEFAPDGTKTIFAHGLTAPDFLAFEPVTEKIRNLSARGFVGGGDNVLIGGFILGGNALANNVVVLRAIGPSLSIFGINNPLQDPTLELHNSGGAIIASNNDWQDTQAAQIMASGLAPRDPHESAIFATLPAGNYTAVVRGVGDTAGVSIVEVYSVH